MTDIGNIRDPTVPCNAPDGKHRRLCVRCGVYSDIHLSDNECECDCHAIKEVLVFTGVCGHELSEEFLSISRHCPVCNRYHLFTLKGVRKQ